MRAGGGFNHRDSLSDAVLIKDNHLAVLGLGAGRRARPRPLARPHRSRSSATRSSRSPKARDAGVDLVLLDNMTPDEVREGGRRSSTARAKVEVSGGITLDTVGAYARSRRRLHLGRRAHALGAARSTSASTITRELRRCCSDDRRGEHADGGRAVPRRRARRPLAHRDRRRPHLRRARADDAAVPRLPRLLVRRLDHRCRRSRPVCRASPPSCAR